MWTPMSLVVGYPESGLSLTGTRRGSGFGVELYRLRVHHEHRDVAIQGDERQVFRLLPER